MNLPQFGDGPPGFRWAEAKTRSCVAKRKKGPRCEVWTQLDTVREVHAALEAQARTAVGLADPTERQGPEG